MKTLTSKLRFELSGYYFIGLVGLILVGFWPSYFSKFYNGTADFTFYFHFHTSMVGIWILMLIVQPLLIRKKKLALHRLIGKASYLVFSLVFVSIILLSHSRQTTFAEGWDIGLFVTFKDLLILGVAYFIAIKYRHKIDLHARGMIATGLVCIEPAAARIPFHPEYGYFVVLAVVYSVLGILIFIERNQKKGRWVFPLILALYIMVHSVLIFGIHFSWWQAFGRWFYGLPLT
jgi:heme exporter protein D